jgi:hypothetical protein
MVTNSHYGHLSVRDGRSLRVATFFGYAGGGCIPCIPYGVSAPGNERRALNLFMGRKKDCGVDDRLKQFFSAS